MTEPSPLARNRVQRLLGGEDAKTPQTPEAFWENIYDRVKQIPGAVENMVTGEGRAEFDHPELGTSGPSVPALSKPGMKMAGAYATSTDPQQIADIAVKTLPGATASIDAMGNPIVTFEGQDYYVNMPGLSEADAFQLLSQAGAYAPAGRAGLVSRNLVGRAAKTGTGAMATSAALDTASTALGSEQGISGERMGIAFGLGAIGDLIAPVAKKAWRKIVSSDDLFDPLTQSLTEKGKAVARAADLDPNDISSGLGAELAKQAKDEPLSQVAGSKALTEQHGIKYTAGQQTQNLGQQAREEGLRHGAFGLEAQAGMRAFDKQQAGQVGEAVKGVQGKLGKAMIQTEAEAGDALSEGLMREVRKLDKRIDDAYALAGSTEASIKDPHAFNSLAETLVKTADDFGLDPVLHPASAKILGELRKFVPKTKQPSMSAITGVKAPPPSKTTIAQIEQARRRVNNWISSAVNNADRKLANSLKYRLDDWMDEAVDNALFEGSPEALENLKQARVLRTEKRVKFDERKKAIDPAGKAIKRMVVQDPTPEQMINWIYGANKLGSRETSAGVAKRLKDIFPEGSLEWDMLREAGWLRLTQNKAGDTLSPVMIRKNLRELVNLNPTLAKTLYNADELSLMKELSTALMKATTDASVKNPSQTAWTIMRIAKALVARSGTAATFSGQHMLGGGLFTMARLIPGNLTAARGAAMAKQAIKGLPYYSPRAPKGVAAGVAAGQLTGEEP